jgi:hypothetical protein
LGNNQFATLPNYYSGSQANDAVAADFTGDGFNDVLVCNEGAGSTAFFPGDGAGNLGSFTSYATGVGSAYIAAGDLNGDTHLDAVVSNTASNDVQILINDGSGNFSVTAFTVGFFSGDLRLRDLTGDNHPELIILAPSANQVYVFPGNGAGSFGAGSSFTTGTTPSALSLGLINSDANLDLVVANSGSNNFSFFRGNGAGGFAAAANHTVGTLPKGIAITDLNGDGFNDVITANNGSSSISIRAGDGTGAFGAATSVAGLSRPLDVVAADFNADGDVDLAVSNNTSGEVAVISNNGTGTMTLEAKFAVGLKPVSLSVADFNSDNLPDLVSADRDQNGISLLLNTTAVITTSGVTDFCGSGSVDLTSTPAYSYAWSGGSTAQMITVSSTSVNNVTTTNFNGSCSSLSQDVTVAVHPLPTVLSISGSTTICSGTSAVLTAITDATTPDIFWYDAAIGGSLLMNNAVYTTPILVAPESYYVEVIDLATGCTSASRFQVDVVIGDVTDPVISGMPANIVQPASAGSCGAAVSWTAPTATDNCALNSLTSSHPIGSTFPVGTTTVTYTATDNALNTATASFTVTIEDNQDPIISGMPAAISQPAISGTCAATVSWTAPSATDSCALLSLVSSHPSGSSFPVGTTTVTYTATDIHSNVSTESFDVVVTDAEAPVISGVPANISLPATAGQCAAVATWTSPTASDNCAVLSLTSSHASGASFPVGTTTVTYTATDVNSNVATVSFDVTVTDMENPAIVGMPANISVSNDAGLCGAVVSWTAPTATDNCSATLSVSYAPGSFFPVGTTTVIYTAFDPALNFVTASFTVTVTDSEEPTISGLPTNIGQATDAGSCGAVVTWTLPTAFDNCGTATLTSSHNRGDFFPIGITTVTYTATDANSNVFTNSFNVNIIDSEAPVFSNCPVNMNACEGDVINYTVPVATDNCGSPAVSLILGQSPGTVFPVGTTLVRYQAIDAQGNFVNCTFNVTVNAAPTATIALVTDQACDGSAALTLSGGSPTGGIYSGNGVSGTNTFTPTAAGVGTHTISYTVINGNGCEASVDDIFTVHALPTVSFTINDDFACVNHAVITLSGGAPSGGSYSGTGVSDGVFTPATAGAGTHTVTYSFTDGNWCVASTTDEIVVDNCTGLEMWDLDALTVYPNPTSGLLFVEGLTAEPAYYQVFSVTGDRVLEGATHGENRVALDLSAQASGPYFLHVWDDHGQKAILRIVLQR